MYRIEPVKEIFKTETAFFSVVKENRDKPQRAGGFIEHDHGAAETLKGARVSKQVQKADQKNASGSVICLKEKSQSDSGCHDKKLSPFVLDPIGKHHDEHPEKEGEKHILFIRIEPVSINGQIERDFGNQSEEAKPEKVFFFASGMQKSLYQKETENRESQPSDRSKKPVKKINLMIKIRIGTDGGKRQNPLADHYGSEMIDQHSDNGDEL